MAFLPGAKTPTLVAVGPAGSDYSSDDGRTWKAMTGAPGLHAFSVAKRGGAAWGVGESGRVAKLTFTRQK